MENKSKNTKGGSSSEASKTAQQRKYDIRVFTYDQLNEMTNQFEKMVGEGKYAKVYKGRLNNKDIAVKIYQRENMKYWENEREALVTFDHPNIVSLLGVNHKNDENEFCLILNYVPKNLEEVMGGGNLRWPEVHRILLQLAAAITEISGKNFVIGDIKPDNVLIDEEYNVCLCDFGSAKIGGRDLPTVNRYYAAKEVILNGSGTPAADVYSFGVILLQIIMKENYLRSSMTKHKRQGKRKEENEDNRHITVKARLCRPEHVVDKSIINSGCTEADGITLTKLGIQCTNDFVDKRPTIEDVASKLAGLKSN